MTRLLFILALLLGVAGCGPTKPTAAPGAPAPSPDASIFDKKEVEKDAHRGE